MSQERLHSGGKQGRASVNGSPDRGGIHSLSSAIDTPLLLRFCSGCPKRVYQVQRGEVFPRVMDPHKTEANS